MKRLIGTITALLLAAGVVGFQAPAAQAAKPHREMTLNWKQVRNTTTVKLTGKAEAAKRKTIVLQKKIDGRWKSIRHTRTNKETRYVFKVTVPRQGKHKFRTKMKKNKHWANSYSPQVVLYWT